MANKQNKRLRPVVLQADLDAFAALLAIANYKPSNPTYNLDNVAASKTEMETGQTEEVQANAAAEAKRDAAVAGEWAFHNMILGVKDQIKAQYGASSDELNAVGLKKKSEYKTGGGKPKSGSGGSS